MESLTESEFPPFFSLTPTRYAELQDEIHALRAQIANLPDPYSQLRAAWREHQRRYPDASQRFWAAIRQAYKRGIPFDLEPDLYESLVAQPCCRCGGSTGKAVGLDRIDWRTGYVEGNVRPMCGPCNLKRGRKSDEI